MFRTMKMKTRLMFSGVACILAVMVLSGLGIYSLWKADVTLAEQIEIGDAVAHEMALDASQSAVHANVLYAMVIGDGGRLADKERVKKAVEQNISDMEAEMSALAGYALSQEISDQLEALSGMVTAFAESARIQSAKALSDTAEAEKTLSEFNRDYTGLVLKIKPLNGLMLEFAAATATEAKFRDMVLIYTNLGFSAVIIVLMIFNARNIVNSITKPIGRLRAGLKKVSQGEFGMKLVSITRADDFREIAEDIDAVSGRVLVALREQQELRQVGERVIDELREGLQGLASGDLQHRIEHEFSEEYEPLRGYYNETVDRLNELLAEVVDSTAKIRDRSNQLNSGAQELSGRTESQAATLEETAAALEEMTASIKESASNAQKIEQAVGVARNDVDRSGEVVGGAVDAMNSIETSSDKISQIIVVIDDIAFQTSLLALNAGVEAARAGEVGRGFAVVASEVRVLAQRSSDAANEIKALIDESTRHVKDGVQKVHSAGDALSDVVTHVSQISSLMSGISSQSDEQANGLGEINVGVGQLDQVTQENASMVDDSTQAIVSLNQEAISLETLVSRFKLMRDADPSARLTVVDEGLDASSEVLFDDWDAPEAVDGDHSGSSDPDQRMSA